MLECGHYGDAGMESERMGHPLTLWLRRWWMVSLALILSVWIFWPRPALGLQVASEGAGERLPERGAALFAQHCAGCHWNGGNVIRRSKTLKLAALRRAGLEGPEALARVAALGQGQMGGYEGRLGPGGADAVGRWVWSQALADWPKSEQKITTAAE
ncbi:MAG: c-type cytochrome [Cyanobacteriota bacterium]|nr:c-type cytochrome [Cyanobacteriota bacterium]